MCGYRCDGSDDARSNHSFTCGADEPVRRQLRWIVRQLNGAAQDLTVVEVKKHMAPVALKRLPARAYVALFREGAEQAGRVRIRRVVGTHSPWALIAVIDTGNLGRATI
jgi:hypothetical protein